MHISRRRLNQVTFWGLIFLGIGLCVGGIFYPALIAAGAACIGVASAVWNRPEAENPQNEAAHNQDQAIQDDVYIGFGHHNNPLILRDTPCPEYRLSDEDDEQKDSPADDKPGVVIHVKPSA